VNEIVVMRKAHLHLEDDIFAHRQHCEGLEATLPVVELFGVGSHHDLADVEAVIEGRQVIGMTIGARERHHDNNRAQFPISGVFIAQLNMLLVISAYGVDAR
jgi:hypothetical protein